MIFISALAMGWPDACLFSFHGFKVCLCVTPRKLYLPRTRKNLNKPLKEEYSVKHIIFALLALTTVFSTVGAQAGSQESYRYQARYRDWNRGFYTYYGYREQVCDSTLTSYGSVETCYAVQPDDVVYVWERRNGNYRYITVYRDSGYSRSVVDYWVTDDGYSPRVVRRRYNNSYYNYGPTYYERCYSNYYGYVDCYDPYVTSVTINVDFSTAEGKIITGGAFILIGADVISNADSDGEVLIGAASMASGSASAAAGLDQLEKESKLAKSVLDAQTANEKENGDVR